MGTTTTRLRARDGAAISATRHHGGADGTLVFVHGLACSQAFWRAQAEAFARTHDVITFDLAGHGESGGARDDVSIADFARDAHAVLDHFDVTSATLVGHSMGGAVALEAARLLPDRVSRVIGVDTFTYLDYYPRVQDAQVTAIVAALEADFEPAFTAALDRLFVPATDPALRRWIVQAMLATPAPVTIAALAALLRWDLDATLAATPLVPACINAADLLADAAAARYRDRLHVTRFPDAGHFLMLESPDRFNAVLHEHLVA